MEATTRWVRFKGPDGSIGIGTLHGATVAVHEGSLFESPMSTGATRAVADVRILAPCVPSKMVALWNNFGALAAKLGKQPPAHPLYLIKPATCIIGTADAIERPASYAGKIAFEGELGIVIGKRCKDVAAADADHHIFGYTCVNDVTAADILNETPDFAQWCRSKSFDTFGPIGPAIATHIDLSQARVITQLSGVERQNYPLSDMIFSPAELVSRISRDMSLLPGDIIACGTSVGVGSIRDGAEVEVYIEGIGSLANSLRPPAP
jgi:2-keto-4-pentenoate hydratase/2-oxohepta-3-ene-1,7-dioic acid hydratase in catechol pathway